MLRHAWLLLLLLAPAPRGERLVAAFYAADWDAATGEGLTRPDGSSALELHPPDLKGLSYRQPAWHRSQLVGMGEAGIDVALCEFAGRPEAVAALAKALEELATGKAPFPRVAPAAASTADAAAFLAAVPARFVATVDGAPLAWLRPSATASGAALAEFRGAWAAAHDGVLPAVAAGREWGEPDLAVAPGGAIDGPGDGDAVILGPGGRDGPGRVRERDGGAWYERAWYAVLRRKPRLVAVDSWNRYDRATAVGPTREHGREYVESTRKYATMFRKGHELPRPKGKYSTAPLVAWNLTFDPPDGGVKPVDVPGGAGEIVEAAGVRMLTSKAAPGTARRQLAFAVDDSFAWWERRAYELRLDFLDRGTGEFAVEYDGWAGPGRAGPVAFTDSGDWREAVLRLPEAALAGRQEGGSDFRIVLEGRGIALHRVVLRQVP